MILMNSFDTNFSISFKQSPIMIRFIFISFFLILCTSADAQNNSRSSREVTDYVEYLNKCSNGIFLSSYLFENFNAEINQTIDFSQNEQMSFVNSVFPNNFFDTEENYTNILYSSRPVNTLKKKLNPSYSDLAKITQKISQQVNRIDRWRFDVEKHINSIDIENKEQQLEVYAMLDSAEVMVKTYYQQNNQFTKAFWKRQMNYIKTSEFSQLSKIMLDLHSGIYRYGMMLRFQEDGKAKELNARLIKVYDRMNSYVLEKPLSSSMTNDFNKLMKKLRTNSEEAKLFASDFYLTGVVPEDHRVQGKYVYYHNEFSKTTRFNSPDGTIQVLNEIINLLKLPLSHFPEIPYYFKVIYPEKLKEKDLIVSSDSNIEIIPDKLKERIVTASNRTIRVDSALVEMKLYDHMILDGDVLSLNFNGDWILENHSLEKKPKKLKLQLNETGKNYLLLHAENVGKRPPNTMAISYYYKGKKKEIMLKSDLNSSELIEIIIDN